MQLVIYSTSLSRCLVGSSHWRFYHCRAVHALLFTFLLHLLRLAAAVVQSVSLTFNCHDSHEFRMSNLFTVFISLVTLFSLFNTYYIAIARTRFVHTRACSYPLNVMPFTKGQNITSKFHWPDFMSLLQTFNTLFSLN